MSKPHAPSRNGNGKAHAGPEPLGDLESARLVARVARTRAAPDRADAVRLPPEWGEACQLAEDDGRAGLDRWLLNVRVRLRTDSPRYQDIARALDRAQAEDDDQAAESPPALEAPAFDLGLLDAAEFLSREYTLEWLVRGILVANQPCVVGGPKKALKTSLLIDLVVSLATATPFLGEFSIPVPARVAFLSGESGGATIQDTIRRVCQAKDLDPAELRGQAFFGLRLPQLSVAEQLEALGHAIRSLGLKILIVDPLYLCLLSGSPGRRLDAANLFDMGPLLSAVSDICLAAGATPILVHHFKKNRESPNDVPELEDLAFAGIQEFARQWILIGRRERFEPGSGEHRLWLTVGGSAGHSGDWGIDVDEGVMDEEFRGRRWGVGVRRRGDVRDDNQGREKAAREAREAEKLREADERRRQRVKADADATLAKLRVLNRATKQHLRDALAFSGERIGSALSLLLEEGRIRPIRVKVRSGKGEREEDGFEPTDPTLFDPESRTRTNPDEPGQNGVCPGTASEPVVPGRTGGVSPKGNPPTCPGTDGEAEGGQPGGGKPGPKRKHKRPGMEGPRGDEPR